MIVQLLRAAVPRITAIAKSTPEVVSRVAKRLNLAAAEATPSKIIAAAKANKLSAALVMYEMYGIGDDLLTKMMAEDPSIKAAIEAIGGSLDHNTSKLSDGTLSELVQNDDELEIISKAAGIMGSLDRLIALRQALAIPSTTYALYRHTRAVGRKLNA